MRYALVRPARLDLETFARDAHVHPELVRRLVTLGILDADRDASGRLWFFRDQLAALARVQRLRAGFSLNWAAVGLVCDLLERIAALEAAQRQFAHRRSGVRPWT
ncbi:chaperone modulator CbpM [Actinoallomurus sp. CA-150999]|uniref:chaperone modulator CbpM n=1 Tax=Actinoallomurus sp. CA-150999 TaxID=3239887 RepID=UPI003D8E74E4